MNFKFDPVGQPRYANLKSERICLVGGNLRRYHIRALAAIAHETDVVVERPALVSA